MEGNIYLKKLLKRNNSSSVHTHLKGISLFHLQILLLFKSTRLFLAYITQQDQPLKSHYPKVPTNQTDPFFEATFYAWRMEKHYYCHPYTRAVGTQGQGDDRHTFQLTQLPPRGGEDYGHHITAFPSKFRPLYGPVAQRRKLAFKSELTHFFQCSILIPGKWPRKTPFYPTVRGPPD